MYDSFMMLLAKGMSVDRLARLVADELEKKQR